MTQLAQHDDDLRSVGLAESRGQRIADLVRREVLILDVDGVTRGGDHVEIQRFHFAHAGMAVDGRLGARDADGDVAQRIRRWMAARQFRLGCGPARRNMLFFVQGGSSVSCVARRQRSRTRSPSARAAGPSTAIIMSWNGGYGVPAITRC